MRTDKLEALRRYKILTFIHDPDKHTYGLRSHNAAWVHFINGVIEVENGRLISEKYFDKEEEAKGYYRQEIEKQVKNRDCFWPYIVLVDSHYPLGRIPFYTDEIMESYMVSPTENEK